MRGVAIFAKACFGASQPQQAAKKYATAIAFGRPDSSASPGPGPTRGPEQRFHMTLRHIGMPCRLPTLRFGNPPGPMAIGD